MSKPTVTRHTVPDYVEITYSCLSCGESMEYQEGLSCVNCGLEWDDPAGQARMDSDWTEFAEAVAPNATAADPVHLMVFREGDFADADIWYIHVGCLEDTYDHTGKCALTEVVGATDYSRTATLPNRIAHGVPFGLTRARTLTLPTGVYEVEPTSTDGELSLTVTAVLAYGGGDDGQNIGELVDPREAPIRLRRSDSTLSPGGFDVRAWAEARSPQFRAYWTTKAGERRRMAAYREEARKRRERSQAID